MMSDRADPGCVMTLGTALKSFFASALVVWFTTASVAAFAAGGDALKAEIETYFNQLGVVHWDGADTFTARDDGDGAVAVIENARFSVRKDKAEPKPAATIIVDRITIRRKPASGGNDTVSYVISLPAATSLTTSDGTELTLSLADATATALVAEPGDHYRSLTAGFASARIERTGTGDWVKLGPMTTTSRVTATDGGGWSGPIEFELKGLEFLLASTSLAGKTERIGYTGEAGGSSLAELDALRDEVGELRAKAADEPAANAALWSAVLPKLLNIFDHSKGDLTVEGTTVKRPEGETLVTLAKATIAGSVTGLGGDKATVRWTFGHEGLAIAPSLVAEPQVPRRVAIDIGVEDIAGAPLRTILGAAGKTGPGASDADKQAALPQIIGAAMALKPVLRIYGMTIEFKDARVDATGEAERAPPAPIGYTASGDVTAHGFDALPGILTDKNDRMHLSLLGFIGNPGTDADGAKVMRFHLAAQTGKPVSVNGSDLSGWFAGAGQFGQMPPEPPRLLRLADPPETGDDVRAVQKAVKANQVEPLTDGVYDIATALAVARFQKQAGINVSGVVDDATAEKLGLKPKPISPPNPKN
jgi:peptidoglycan hydrolase-like protein with peptidoglycan-binding domain